MVVGWYHSHPGFGCWLSGVDINTQQSFEALTSRAVAVVVDPIQSVKGKVVIDAFRLINPNLLVLGQEPRQTTSNLGHLHKPSIQVRWACFKLFICSIESSICCYILYNFSLFTCLSDTTFEGLSYYLSLLVYFSESDEALKFIC